MKKDSEPTKKFDNRSKPPKSRLQEMSPKKVVTEAQRIVGLATDILEEEIAAGIIAAKEIEKKVIDVKKVRDKNSDHIISRFRSDAHEVIDILMDVVSVASTQLETISNRLVNIKPTGSASAHTSQVPVIRAEKALDPGHETEIKMQLQNDKKDKPMKVSMFETDLISSSGNRILSRNIEIIPKTITLAPGEKKVLSVKVRVPKNTKSGKYSGLLQDRKIDNLQAMLSLDVN